MSKTSIIIVNWNTGELLAQCLKSLSQLKDEEIQYISEVIVIDNASHDNSIVLAKQVVSQTGNKPKVRFVQNKENIGFAAANNIGIDRATQYDHAPHVLLLNPDTEIRPGQLENLIGELERHEFVGILGPKLLNPDGTIQPSVRSFPTFWVFLFFFLKLNHVIPTATIWQKYMRTDFNYEKAEHVDQVMGAAFLVRDCVLEMVGDLDSRFWIWFEEVDYCKRVRERGWRIMYDPTAQVIHHGGVSFNKLHGMKKNLLWLASSLKYSSKHLGPLATFCLYLLSPVAVVLAIPASILAKRSR